MALLARLDIPLRSLRLAIDLRVESGTEAIVGPSGAGKTRTLRAIAGLLRPRRGLVRLDDEVWFDDATGRDLPPERRSVGLVFQDYALFPHMTVGRNVAFAGPTRADALIDRLGIRHLARAYPGTLSGGERQRVALARALASDPRVLLLDEPLAALDPQTRTGVRRELSELLGGVAMPTLLVTHDLDDVTALASRAHVMEGGRVVQSGTPSELAAAPATAFVARLTGRSLLPGHAAAGPRGLTRVALDAGGSVLSTDRARGPVMVALHTGDATVAADGAPDANGVHGPVSRMVRRGNQVSLFVGELATAVSADEAARMGLTERGVAFAGFAPEAARLVVSGPGSDGIGAESAPGELGDAPGDPDGER